MGVEPSTAWLTWKMRLESPNPEIPEIQSISAVMERSSSCFFIWLLFSAVMENSGQATFWHYNSTFDSFSRHLSSAMAIGEFLTNSISFFPTDAWWTHIFLLIHTSVSHKHTQTWRPFSEKLLWDLTKRQLFTHKGEHASVDCIPRTTLWFWSCYYWTA